MYKALFPTCRGHIQGAITRDSGSLAADALSRLSPDEVAAQKSRLVALHLNLALCAGKDGNFSTVRLHATTVLGADAENVKALFRRGAAASAQGDYEVALEDLQKAAELQPQDKAVRRELHELRVKIKKFEELEKAIFQRAFKPNSRVSAADGHKDTATPDEDQKHQLDKTSEGLASGENKLSGPASESSADAAIAEEGPSLS